jgi:hypothetical protein
MRGAAAGSRSHRGLCVAASLGWFGQRYHWTRRVAGAAIQLDRVFEQDIFDFKSTLALAADGSWARDEQTTVSRHRFEIRSRFHDTLTAPYWRAVWGELPAADDPSITDARVRRAIESYKRVAERPGLLRAYQAARVHALRWLEERVRLRNPEIVKPALDIAGLREFELGINTTARAAIDFLLLDQHVKMAEWITTHIQPPAARVQSGRTIPVHNVRSDSDRNLIADFDVRPFGLAAESATVGRYRRRHSCRKLRKDSDDCGAGSRRGGCFDRGATVAASQTDASRRRGSCAKDNSAPQF